jgi:metal-responsive CopG/Arc/MetJ family transcriptional regulator
MRSLRVNFTIPEDLASMLKAHVSERKRSAFVASAIRDRLLELEQERLRKTLIEGYAARRSEDKGITEEWEPGSPEDWR